MARPSTLLAPPSSTCAPASASSLPALLAALLSLAPMVKGLVAFEAFHNEVDKIEVLMETKLIRVHARGGCCVAAVL